MTTKCVVTGGSGFVGKALVKALLGRGYRVVSLSRRDVPELRAAGAEVLQVDLSEESQAFAHALEGAHGLFHVAAHVKMWGRYDEFYRYNVTVTKNLLDLAATWGVGRFIYTSSPSVVADGRDLEGIDESYPYPARHHALYPKTKAIAEREVLTRNGRAGMRTLALRPHLIFGPGDTNLAPTILEKGRAGELVRIGNGSNLSDFTYIDDCVQAHLDAFDALERNPGSSGKAYFISQGDPVPLWEFVDRVLELNGLPRVERSIPKWAASSLATLAEIVATLRPSKPDPRLTRFLVSEMATSHYFSINRARRELSYSPSISVRDALERTFSRDGETRTALSA